MPTRAVKAVLQADELTVSVNKAAGVNLTTDQLYSLLKREPATWGGLSMDGPSWIWDVTQSNLRPFRGVVDFDDLLVGYDTLIGTGDQAAQRVSVLPAYALPEALDHLDLAWRVTQGSALLGSHRLGVAASLSMSANSRDEFASRLVALADVLAQFRVPESPEDLTARPLRRLALWLESHLEDTTHPAHDAVTVLQQLTRVRNSFGHPGSAHAYEKDHIALGLRELRGSWDASWDRVRAVTVEALRTIREAILALPH